MTEETMKALAEAMNRLAAAIENLPRHVGLAGGGISVTHQHLGGYNAQQPQWQGGNFIPSYSSGNNT